MDPTARSLALWTFALTPAVSIAFRLLGVARTQRFLREWSEPAVLLGDVDVATLISAVRKSQAIFLRNTRPRDNCLARSLALWAILRRRNLGTRVQVGFRSRDGKMEGHAWVEYEGQPLNESAEQVATYTVSEHGATYDRDLRLTRPAER